MDLNKLFKMSPRTIEILDKIKKAWRNQPNVVGDRRTEFLDYLRKTPIGMMLASHEKGDEILNRYADFYTKFAIEMLNKVEAEFPEAGIALLVLQQAADDISSALMGLIGQAAIGDLIKEVLPQILNQIAEGDIENPEKMGGKFGKRLDEILKNQPPN